MRRLLPALLIALAWGASATPAGAVSRDFYGVDAQGDPNAAELKRMGKGKVGTFRANFYWPAVEPIDDFAYFWSRYDNLIGNAARAGVRVLPTIYGSPPWAAKRPEHPPRAGRRDEFAAFMRAAVERYGRGGQFWAENPDIPAKPVHVWQLWNEVSSPTFWYARPKPIQYKRLLAVAAHAIRQADPKAKIILAGMFPNPNHPRAIPMKAYLSKLYRLRTKKLFDGVAVHPYAITPRQVIRTIARIRALMRRFKDGATPIYVTEIGWASSGRRTVLTVKPKRQAKYLRQTYLLARRNKKRLRIASVIWFSWRDHRNQRRTRWVYRSGLFTAGFKAKPAWRAYARLTGGRPF